MTPREEERAAAVAWLRELALEWRKRAGISTGIRASKVCHAAGDTTEDIADAIESLAHLNQDAGR